MKDLKKDRIEKGQLKRMVQAVGMVYVFLLLPVCIPFTVQTKEGENRQRIEKAVRTESKNIETEDEADTEDQRIKPKVALTFDDGPSMEYTPMLLEGLKERGVKASFFLIGCNIEKEGNKEIVKQMYEDGHLIGNHTFHHVELTSLSREQALIELKETSDLIEEITGETVEYVRPPFGSWSCLLYTSHLIWMYMTVRYFLQREHSTEISPVRWAEKSLQGMRIVIYRKGKLQLLLPVRF